MSKEKKTKGINRNLTSYADEEFSKYMRRAFLSSAGYDKEDLSRPVVGIVDTTSDYNTCHRQMPEMVSAVKRGVLETGGIPFAFPTISLNEILTHPTTMLYRNLLAMETEEMITAQPMDAVVLIGGCDKTVPAQMMAAISANMPAVVVVAGSMMTGYWRGERLGACTDCRRMWARYRAGELDKKEIEEVEGSLVFTGGTCMVMGTASTMACMAETLGLMLPGGAAPPHASGERLKNCVASGRAAVEMIGKKVRPKDILTKGSFLNSVTVLMALSGSTNAVIHLTAVARRAGIDLALSDFDEISRRVPVLVDCKPAGKGYMEDFYHAGGLPALLKALEPHLDLNAKTITGRSLGDILKKVEGPGPWQDTIRRLDNPLYMNKDFGAISVLTGSLAPDGAVIKAAAADPKLLRHRGPAVVFDSPEDAQKRIDDPDLKITPDHVMVLKNAGPVGSFGMPEAGSLPIPKYLSKKGVKDMVRVSDGRMSGTSYGAVVLHVSPETAVGGPIALVEDGDMIELDVGKRIINLEVSEDELKRRRERFTPPKPPERGWKKLFVDHVQQAHLGCDLDFL
ncbi:MAG: dihydroxy-acid dehydratase [Deltaproteobacteria bacterium]|uniref:Dihydroxy-acid dehydratase n=1 Tax=Candidatus Zymogenus saltonus TaxID=2844893 RepID=A0A9D8K9S1_9DELT|nr:dihydroxy-acid dehydratase [Candidatus Zymogenus saltonus]